jgi:hypothetical protein
VDDSPGWDAHTPGPADRPWSEPRDDLDDALTAWRKNFLVRRIVALTRSYVVGNGITVTSPDPHVRAFLQRFWTHPQNHMDDRLGPMCDELTRAGELFAVLFTNRADGLSYLRFLPASRVRQIETDPEDYERELRYRQLTLTGDERWWLSHTHPAALRPGPDGALPPAVLHLAVNRPIGATRGEGDLTPVLPWALRYSEWLKDRVRLNRQRTRQAMMDVALADDTVVEQKRQQLRTANPLEHGIYVHGPGETVTLHNLQLAAADAADDGKALRLAIATGAHVALHYLGEGEGTNYATAREMGEPTARFYTDRQTTFRAALVNLARAAYARFLAVTAGEAAALAADPPLATTVAEVARADNESLASAARSIATALAILARNGWIDDQTAVQLALKFAGEPLTDDEAARILQRAGGDPAPAPQQEADLD